MVLIHPLLPWSSQFLFLSRIFSQCAFPTSFSPPAPFRFMTLTDPDAPAPASQPNEGSIGNRNHQRRMSLRDRFKSVREGSVLRLPQPCVHRLAVYRLGEQSLFPLILCLYLCTLTPTLSLNAEWQAAVVTVSGHLDTLLRYLCISSISSHPGALFPWRAHFRWRLLSVGSRKQQQWQERCRREWQDGGHAPREHRLGERE